ncbi:hypothetical protein KPH14_006853 [Odynerus spinipes]|uniref:TBC1 domain family member 30 n=1 Tax=Odynerus spinipes TaxID=1348599 RepID=A0AAD9VRM6_9HYME|nr:hypothetical protein KPH14_006853 [Odynerus spinipes]
MSGFFNSLKNLASGAAYAASSTSRYQELEVEDTKMRFSLTPQPGESGFQQWLDAMKMVARLPGGIPAEFRKRLWLTLAERHLEQRGVDWKQAEKVCFNEWSNPDDEELGIQIVKDLHRTGCSLFCGAAGRDNQAVLRRVLLGFARWNKSVGYCQGLNVLAALVLQVMDRAESSAVKVMIYLIEGVLPEGYFADNLRGLSVDMAVFRDLLRSRMPKLSKHLEALQSDAKDKSTGNSYEPPLTNVFTMQWFLTLFCHCLPQDAVLRVWDLIFLEGDEVLLRTALAIWESLSDRIMTVTSADEFYSIMGVLTREMLEFTDTNNLIKNIVSLGPLHGVTGLREKHRYNITPWARKLSDDEDSDTEEDERLAVAAAMFSMAQRLKKGELLSEHISSTVGAIQAMAPGSDRERLALDISTLKQQYAKLRERQRQAHIILSAACARQSMVPPPTSQAMNHLLVGKNALVSGKNRPLNLSSVTTPSKMRPAVLHSPRTQTRKERQQGVTLHWKDTKKQKQKCVEAVVETTENKISVQSPEETTDDLTSPKSGGVESDSDSTSTELCDEPDRYSDVDSEEQTSVSDNYYVMASEEERSGRIEGSSTSGNSPVRSPRDVPRLEKSMTISHDVVVVVDGHTTVKGEGFARQEKMEEGVSPELAETSIAKITDQIRRLSAEDDNNMMVPQILSGASKIDDSVIRTSIGEEAQSSRCENEIDASSDERKKKSSFDTLDDRNYFTFSYDDSKTENNKTIVGENNKIVEMNDEVKEKVNNLQPIMEINVDDYDKSVGTSDKVDELVSKKSITDSDIVSKYDTVSPIKYYDKDNEYSDGKEKRFELSFDSYKVAETEDRKDNDFEILLDNYKSIKSSDTSEKSVDVSVDSYKPIKSPDKKEKVFETPLDISKTLKTPDTNDKRFETSFDSYKLLKSPDRNDRRFEVSTNAYKSLKSPETNSKQFEVSLDTYKPLKSPDTSERRFETSLDSYKALKSPEKNEKRFETSLDSYKPLKSPEKNETRFETSLDSYKSLKSLDTSDERFEVSLNSYKSLKSPDASLESSKIVKTSEINDKPFEISLSSYKSIKSPDASEQMFEASLHPYRNVFSSPKQNLSDTSPTSSVHSRQPFYSKTYVMGHVPISPVTVDQKISALNKVSYSIDNNTIVALESGKNSDDPLDRPTFSDKLQTIDTKSYTETTKKSPRTPESSKSFSSGETMGPDSKPSSLTVSPRTPVRSTSREFSMDKSMCSSISSDSKTLILQSTESDVARESPRLDAKKLSYEKSSPSTPISTDSLKNKSEASPKLIISSDSCDSCSPSKVKSSERSFSSDLQSPISANSIKYTSNYSKRGQDNISDSSLDLSTAVSPFYPIAHPNQKTPSPYSVSRRRCSTDSAETSPEQRLSVSKEPASKYSSKLDSSLKMEDKEGNGISTKSDAYVRPQFISGKDNLCLNLLGRDKERSDSRIYELGANEVYRNDQHSTDENADDQLSEKDTVSQLPQEKLDKHFMNLNYRHKDRSRIFERSSSSLDRRFADLKSSASTDEFSTSIAKKRSSDILEDMKHLEAKAFGHGPAESGMLTKKTSYIWEDFMNLEARRQDNFSNSASNFSKHRLDIPDISVTNEGRKSYVVHPKINIDESSDSILKTVSCKKSNATNDDEDDDGRESKLGVWTKVKPRKRGNNGRRSSDRALKIIQENSAILHKILACQAKKRLPDLEEISKEITISPINEEISKIFSPILEKMGLNEHEINEELARINFKDFDSMAATSVSEFDAKINEELSKLSLIDDTEQLDDLDVDEIISHEYLDTREALIDRKINEELSKLLANYEEEPRLSMATLEKGSSSQNISDTEGLDLTSISTNVFSYKSSNDSIETRSDQGSLQEVTIQSERFSQYAQPMIPYGTSTYVQDLSPKSDIDIYRELEKLDKISSAQVMPDTSPDISPKTLSPASYVPSVSPYSDVPTSMRYSPNTMPFDSSPLKTTYDPYKSFDFKTNLSPRRVPSNPYTPRPYDNVTDSNFEYFDHKTGLCPNSYDVHLKSPILTKESLEFRVRYDNESPRQLSGESFALPTDVVSKQMSIEKSVLYYTESNNIVTPTKYGTKEGRPPLQDVIGSSFLDYPPESSSDLLHRKYDSPSPRNYIHDKSPEYERPYTNLAETKTTVGTYLPIKLREYQPTLSPNRQPDQPFPSTRNYYATTKLSPGVDDEMKRPVSHPEFPDKVTISQYPEPPSRGSSCYKKSSLSLGNIGRASKNGHGGSLNATPSPKAQFSPFPVKNTSKKPKELALKLGLYSPKGSASGPLRKS